MNSCIFVLGSAIRYWAIMHDFKSFWSDHILKFGHITKALVGWIVPEAHKGPAGEVEEAFAEERCVSSESLSGSTWPKESVHVLAKFNFRKQASYHCRCICGIGGLPKCKPRINITFFYWRGSWKVMGVDVICSLWLPLPVHILS